MTTQTEPNTTYNGWTNSETWRVNLWLNNDEYLDAQSRAITREADDAYEAATELQGWVESAVCGEALEGASLASDLLGAALRRVNWEEIAEAYREDMPDEDSDA